MVLIQFWAQSFDTFLLGFAWYIWLEINISPLSIRRIVGDRRPILINKILFTEDKICLNYKGIHLNLLHLTHYIINLLQFTYFTLIRFKFRFPFTSNSFHIRFRFALDLLQNRLEIHSEFQKHQRKKFLSKSLFRKFTWSTCDLAWTYVI